MDNLMSPFDMRNAVAKTLHRVVYEGMYWAELYWAVSCLDHIARHPAGTEDILRQVRLYRRAVAAAARAEGAR